MSASAAQGGHNKVVHTRCCSEQLLRIWVWLFKYMRFDDLFSISAFINRAKAYSRYPSDIGIVLGLIDLYQNMKVALVVTVKWIKLTFGMRTDYRRLELHYIKRGFHKGTFFITLPKSQDCRLFKPNRQFDYSLTYNTMPCWKRSSLFTYSNCAMLLSVREPGGEIVQFSFTDSSDISNLMCMCILIAS